MYEYQIVSDSSIAHLQDKINDLASGGYRVVFCTSIPGWSIDKGMARPTEYRSQHTAVLEREVH